MSVRRNTKIVVLIDGSSPIPDVVCSLIVFLQGFLIASKWVMGNFRVFYETGHMWEKVRNKSKLKEHKQEKLLNKKFCL